MAQVIWLEPAESDLDEIAEYIALDNTIAAANAVGRVLAHVAQLAAHPLSGSVPSELPSATKYRQIVERPCRVFYRVEGDEVYILHVLRFERVLRLSRLERDQSQ
jgi:toxin ParE1/3/4